MIEVFKTDVNDIERATLLIDRIHERFHHCRANFDLDDCDRILRVTGIACESETYQIISLVKNLGCHAQILPDDDQLDSELFFHDSEFSQQLK